MIVLKPKTSCLNLDSRQVQNVKSYTVLISGNVSLQNAPFFVTKLAIKTLPCVILFR
jgi:hypothetical protein